MAYFTWSMFDSPDEPGSGYAKMDKNFTTKLHELCDLLKLRGLRVNSGYRTLAYTQDLIKRGYKASLKSAHMEGKAADVDDLDGALKQLITEDVLKKLDLWAEDYSSTPTWVHLTNRPVASQKRFFLP